MDCVSVVTWNLGGLNDSEGALDERTEAQCFALLLPEPRPDVLLLQELVHRSWHAHWKHHLRHARYRVLPADPTTDSEYFSLVAVREDLPVANHGSPLFPGTFMGRRLVWAEVGGWWLSTAHLESGRPSAPERVRQLASIVAQVRGWAGPAAFAGDTNLRVSEEDRVEGLAGVTDAWVAAGRPSGLKATWRSSRPEGGGGLRGARFDRILCNERVVVGSLKGFGDGLSDHLGLRVELRRKG
jgi:endonuclease/exonuclease/phosphatase family metal-dependent hydrolase